MPGKIPTDLFNAMRRETTLLLDRSGTIVWADDRAPELLALAPGNSLVDATTSGVKNKVKRFLDEAIAGPVTSCEVILTVRGVHMPVMLHSRPHNDGIAAVASLLAESTDKLMSEMSQLVSELSTLHRESERQQREIVSQRSDISRLSGDLVDSGRGMESLYQELSDQAEVVRVVSEGRSRFIAGMSHELRTPLNSITGLTKLLLSRIDGDLTSEQEKQIGFIRQSAETLSELVNDLLDLAKIESGKHTMRPSEFTVESLFSALRGMMRPLVTTSSVHLVFDNVEALPSFNTDQNKLAQILRNLISNAIKFTENGEIRVSALVNDDDTVTIGVRDTGVGIPPDKLHAVFEEFTQVDHPLQALHKGTGLGLTISSRLAHALGGTLTVESTLGVGSLFTLTVPRVHGEVSTIAEMQERADHLDPTRSPVLVVEDDGQTLFLYEKYLEGSGFQVIPVRSIEAARAVIRKVRPAAVVLDVFLDGETSWSFLSELKRDPRTADIPALVVTVMDREQKARALGADEFFVKPIDRDWLLRKLNALALRGPLEKILVVDDDEVHRYLMRRLLAETEYTIIEAADGPDGVRLAREESPDLIFLDFVMPNATAFDVLDALKADPRTRDIPVIVATSKLLDPEERRRLQNITADVLSKEFLSREVAISRIREALTKAIGKNGVRSNGRVSSCV